VTSSLISPGKDHVLYAEFRHLHTGVRDARADKVAQLGISAASRSSLCLQTKTAPV